MESRKAEKVRREATVKDRQVIASTTNRLLCRSNRTWQISQSSRTRRTCIYLHIKRPGPCNATPDDLWRRIFGSSPERCIFYFRSHL